MVVLLISIIIASLVYTISKAGRGSVLPPVSLRGVTEPRCVVEKVVSTRDKDVDGIYDLDDIVQGARKDLEAKPTYKDAYYAGGYPPPNEGVCTDVIWRALAEAGYDLKGMMDRDIKEHTGDYPGWRVGPNQILISAGYPTRRYFLKSMPTSLPPRSSPGIRKI